MSLNIVLTNENCKLQIACYDTVGNDSAP